MLNKGIAVGDNYRIERLDSLNLVVKKYVPYKEVEQKDGTVKSYEEHWDTVSYHANLKQAINSIFNKEINLIIDDGVFALMDKIQEFEDIVNALEV